MSGGTRQIDIMYAGGRLQFYMDYRGRGLRDLSPSPLALPEVSNAPVWNDRSSDGPGVQFNADTGAVISYGVAAKCDFTTAGTVWCVVCTGVFPSVEASQVVLSKQNFGAALNGYCIYTEGTGPSFVMSVADGVGAQTISRLSTNFVVGKPTFLAMAWDSVRLRGYHYASAGGGAAEFYNQPQTRIPSPAGQTLQVGNADAVSFFEYRSPILILGGSNTALTALEIERLYTDWLESTWVGNLPRRNFYYKYPGKSNAEYAAAGICLDTDFGSEMAGATRRIRDLVNNYPGTLTGTPVPGPAGEGQIFHGGVTERVSFGDVTQLNSATSFTIDGLIAPPPAAIPNGSYWIIRQKDATNTLDVYTTGGASVTPTFNLLMYSGAGGTYGTLAAAIRAGFVQHLAYAYDGPKSTNALRMRFFVEGIQKTLTYTGVIPATAPNLAGFALQQFYSFATTSYKTRVRAPSLTPDQVRDEYLQWGKRLKLRDTLEDVPVSLVASVGAGTYIGSWLVISGDWRCSEDSTGKRWLECVTAGCCVRPWAQSYGTWVFDLQKVSGTGTIYIMLGTQPLARNAATQNGYALFVSASESVNLVHILNGAVDVTYAQSAASWVPVGSTCRYAVSRYLPEGHFSYYTKGSVASPTTWDLVYATAGSNPTAAPATFDDVQWISLNLSAGDKLCLYDPADPAVAFNVYQGVLQPMMGELPNTSPQNTLLRGNNTFHDPAYWQTTGLTLVPSAGTDPFGTPSNAELCTATAGAYAAGTYQAWGSRNVNQHYTHSWYVKSVVGTQAQLYLFDASGNYIDSIFNTTTGALASLTVVGFTNVFYGSESMGGGWWRLWAGGVAPVVSASLGASIWLENIGDSAYIAHAQMVPAQWPGRYVERLT